MAYSASVVWSQPSPDTLVVQVTELEAVAASEYATVNGGSTTVRGPYGTLADVPIFPVGRITHIKATCAVAIQPLLALATGGAAGSQEYVGGQDSQQLNHNDSGVLAYEVPPGRQPAFYGKSRVATGTQSVTTIFTVKEGH